ncbi:MAG TPA: sulfocyanin-like copper-binding protein [bacterium]|nr:sulfocyanin-like copper-binding protein [bacterium]
MFASQVRPKVLGVVALSAAAMATAVAAVPRVHAAAEATFTVVANQTAGNAGENFNGVDHGRLSITVPPGTPVHVKFMNAKSAVLPHSFQVIPLKGTAKSPVLPAQAQPQPAFPGAATPGAAAGITPGKTADVRFTASTAGHYLFICGFPGHALLGMYGTLDVTPGAKPVMVVK